MDPPPDKRRKTDNRAPPQPSSVDDLWDEDDSEDIDALIQSQAICENNNIDAGKSGNDDTSGPAKSGSGGVSGTKLISSALSGPKSISSGLSGPKSSSSALSGPKSSSSGLSGPKSGTTVNPGLSLSSATVRSGARVVGKGTVKSRSSNDALMTTDFTPKKPSAGVSAVRAVGGGMVAQTAPGRAPSGGGMVTHMGHSASAPTRPVIPKSASSPSLIGAELERVKSENDKLQKQLATLSSNQLSSQGRIKILQERLSQRDAEMQKVKHDKLEQTNVVAKEQNDKEKSWQVEIQKLNSELQFLQKELQDELQKKKGIVHNNKPTAASSRPGVSPKPAYDFSGDFQPSQKVAASKPKTDSQVHTQCVPAVTAAVTTTPESEPAHPLLKMGLKLKNPRGNISGSDLVCKLMQLQLPSRPSTQHPVSPGVAEILGDGETPNVDTLSSDSTSGSTESVVVGSACAKFYQSNIMLTRTMTLLLKCSPARPGATDLLHSDTLSATHLLPVIEDNLDTYITILESLQSSVVSPREGSSSTSDSSPSTETSSSGLSLPKGISASFISVLEKQVHKLIQVLKTLVVYSAPVRHVLLGQHSSSSRNAHTSAQAGTSCADSEKKITHGCQILQKLCRLANPKIFYKYSSSLQVCVLSLEILTSVIEHCPLCQIEKCWNELVLSEVILACISEDIDSVEDRYRLGTSALQLLHTVTRSHQVISLICTKNDCCILDNVYHFCVQSLTDQSSSKSVVHQDKLLQIVSGILSHGRSSYRLLTTDDCHCGEVVNHLVSVLHHVYIADWYLDNRLALHVLHQGASVLQNLAAYDKDFTQAHENNAQYVEFIYAMEHIYKTRLKHLEAATQDLLIELRHDLSGEEEMEETHPQNPVMELPSTSRINTARSAGSLTTNSRAPTGSVNTNSRASSSPATPNSRLQGSATSMSRVVSSHATPGSRTPSSGTPSCGTQATRIVASGNSSTKPVSRTPLRDLDEFMVAPDRHSTPKRAAAPVAEQECGHRGKSLSRTGKKSRLSRDRKSNSTEPMEVNTH